MELRGKTKRVVALSAKMEAKIRPKDRRRRHLKKISSHPRPPSGKANVNRVALKLLKENESDEPRKKKRKRKKKCRRAEKQERKRFP